MASLNEDRVIRLTAAAALLGVTTKTLFLWRKAGLIAEPIKIGPRECGYRESTLRAFIESREGGA